MLAFPNGRNSKIHRKDSTPTSNSFIVLGNKSPTFQEKPIQHVLQRDQQVHPPSLPASYHPSNPPNSKEDFKAAAATPDKYAFIYVYENEIPEIAKEKFSANAGKYDSVAVPFVVDIAKSAEAKEHLKIEKVPTVLLYKDGEEVKRVEEPNGEKMRELEALFVKG